MGIYLVIRQKELEDSRKGKISNYISRDIVAVCDSFEKAVALNRRIFNKDFCEIQEDWHFDTDRYGYENYGNGELIILNEYFYHEDYTSIRRYRYSTIKVNTNEFLLEA